MSDYLAAIEAEGAAADALTQICTRRQFISPDEEGLPAGVLPFRRAFRSALVTPSDMIAALGKLP
jgi:hypothetical protein